MSFMTNFGTEEDFGNFMRDQNRKEAGIAKSAHPNIANPSPGAFPCKDDTLRQTSYSNVDPVLLSQSDGDRTIPGSNVAPRTTHQPISEQQAPRQHALAHPRAAHHQYIRPAANSSTSCPSRKISTRSEERGSNVQIVTFGTQTDNTQGQPPKKKQRTSRVQRNIATPGTATREAQEIREPAKQARKPPKHRDGITRRIDGRLEWFHKEDLRWKPADHHHKYRAELIAQAAQQPGAPLWTKDMGDDYTSFSRLTQGWNENPESIVDSKGRRVFSMERRPADWIRNPKYGLLIYNGLVMLDKKDDAVRDIPGLPLTLGSKAPPWLLAGLTRCMHMHIPDLEARLPDTRQKSTGDGSITSLSRLPQRMRRWYEIYGFKRWNARPNAQRTKRFPQAERDFQESEAVTSWYLPPAEPELRLGDPNSDLSGQGPNFSPRTSYERNSTYDTAQLRADTYDFDDTGSPLSSWETSALAEHDGRADTVHIPIPKSYNSNTGLQRAPDYNDNHYDACNLSSSSDLDNGYRMWSPNDHTAMPYYQGRQSIASSYDFGNETTYAKPKNALPSETACSPNLALEFPMQQIESPKLPRSHGGQEQPHSGLTDTTISADTQDDLFSGGDFRYIPPRTAAEIAFVQNVLCYTRSQYKLLMLREPPGSSHLLSYAEQYSKMQQDVDKNWPNHDFAPVKLRAIGPEFGGMENWQKPNAP